MWGAAYLTWPQYKTNKQCPPNRGEVWHAYLAQSAPNRPRSVVPDP